MPLTGDKPVEEYDGEMDFILVHVLNGLQYAMCSHTTELTLI